MRFILLVIPIPKISNDTDYYVKELLIFVKSLIPIEIVLLDRGFYSWGVIKVLQKLKLGFFKRRVPFRRFGNILFRRHIIKAALFAVIELLGEKDILDDKGPPPDKIYEELIGKFGYIDGVSL